ncbi:hypothetical protein B0H34DRAFT_670936 [Crassisporium funariophilum]|nr:hypothetical protein B0H34DRAFT_670936 [Crassisporium funariophilum]
MSLQLLPVELIDAISHHLHRPDLLALSSTNSRFYHVAQRLLYRHISIDVTSRNLGVVLTLAQKPHIARHVRTFAIRLNPFSLLKSFYCRLGTALSNMSELTSLDIFVDQAASWVMRTRDDATYRRLQHFASSFHLDHNVAHFLNKTDALSELEIDSLAPSFTHTIPSLRANALPRLSQFNGSSHAAQYVVPGRPVQTIHLNSGDLTEDVAESLAKSTARILILAAATSSHSVPLIGTLTQCMEHLVHLRIVTTYNFSDAPEITYFTNIANALTSLPDLKTCEIWGLHWVSTKKNFHDEERVWQSESFNADLLTDNTLLDDLYSSYYT